MTASDVLDIITRLAEETAEAAAKMDMITCGKLGAIGAEKGVAIRLQAFADVRDAIVTAGLSEYETQDVSASTER